MKFKILTVLLSFVIFSINAYGIKPCNNVELCQNELNSLTTDSVKCEKLADLIFIGTLKFPEKNSIQNINQNLEIELDKIEKGNRLDLKVINFQIGCWVGDDTSVPLGDVKKSKGPRFRFYLKKSLKDPSGFKIIHYEIFK